MTYEPGPELDALVAEKVMGIDLTAHDDETYGKAAISGLKVSHGPRNYATVEWNGVEYDVPFAGAYNVGASGNSGHGLHWWHNRQGQPWEHDLEAHVAAWRDRPRPYSTSIADALGDVWDKLEHRGLSPGIYKRGNVYRAHADVATNHWEEHESKPMAFCLAALKAVGAINE